MKKLFYPESIAIIGLSSRLDNIPADGSGVVALDTRMRTEA
jgi:acyl-CoA synthetase (NDP forming)